VDQRILCLLRDRPINGRLPHDHTPWLWRRPGDGEAYDRSLKIMVEITDGVFGHPGMPAPVTSRISSARGPQAVRLEVVAAFREDSFVSCAKHPHSRAHGEVLPLQVVARDVGGLGLGALAGLSYQTESLPLAREC